MLRLEKSVIVGIAGVLVVVCALSLFLLLHSNHKKPTTPYAICLNDYNDSNLCHYYTLALDAKLNRPSTSYDTSVTNGKTRLVTDEIDSEGNSETSTTGLVAISFKGTVYVQTNSNGKWYETALAKVPKDTTAPDSDNTFGLEPKSSNVIFKDLGLTKCGNASCYKYQIIKNQDKGDTTYIWFNSVNYHLIENYTSNKTTTSTIIYKYGPIPAITPPAQATQLSN